MRVGARTPALATQGKKKALDDILHNKTLMHIKELFLMALPTKTTTTR